MGASSRKVYYSISEVAEKLQLKPSLIRFWEKEFPQLSPRKTRKGNRKFSKEDIELLGIIRQLIKKQGYTIEGARQVLHKDKQDLRERSKRIQELKEVHDFLCQLRDAIAR